MRIGIYFKIMGSRPRAYKNIDRRHPCLTDLKILKIGVKAPFISILDSIFVYNISNHFIKFGGKSNFLKTILRKLCPILS